MTSWARRKSTGVLWFMTASVCHALLGALYTAYDVRGSSNVVFRLTQQTQTLDDLA